MYMFFHIQHAFVNAQICVGALTVMPHREFWGDFPREATSGGFGKQIN